MDSRIPTTEPLVCIGGHSALECWREVRSRISTANAPSPYDPNPIPLLVRLLTGDDANLDLAAMPRPSGTRAAPTSLVASSIRETNELARLSRPLTCLVGRDVDRHLVTGAKASVLGGTFPLGSFVAYGPRTIAPSPELLLLLLGRTLSFGRLLMVAAEFCGFYFIDADGALGASPPLTSPTRIAEYSSALTRQRAEGGQRIPRGSGQTMAVVPHVCTRAASPAEAACAYLLGLSRELGGYGLPMPSLNQKVEAVGRDFICDLAWPKSDVFLEYQGRAHAGSSRTEADIAKGNALRAAGHMLFEAGRRDLMTVGGMDRLARLLADSMGCALEPWTAESRRAQTTLRREIFSVFGS